MKKSLVLLLIIVAINSKAQYTGLYNFSSSYAGGYSSLTYSFGLLYGTTSEGGANNGGFIYSIAPTGTALTNLYDFTYPFFTFPCGQLVIDSGIIYGMTSQGSGALGEIYKFNTSNDSFTTLHQFTGCPDGRTPFGSLILSGNVLYGMTKQGGSNGTFADGYGTIFSINKDGTNYTVIYNFTSTENYPFGSLLLKDSVLYGMTSGKANGNNGNIFSINIDGTNYTSLHNFNGTDGKNPNGTLILSGNVLYGMSALGGGGTYPPGNIFKINTDGSGFQVIFASLNGSQYYTWPYGSLTLIGNVLYGKTNKNIYSINTDGTGYQWYNWSSYGSTTGSYEPRENGCLTFDGSFLYGVNNRYGGSYNKGVIYKFTPQQMTDITKQIERFDEVANIFPNPSNGIFNINFKHYSCSNSLKIKLKNSFGQILYETIVNQQSPSIELSDDIGNGIYFVHIIDGQGNTIDIKKIVLQ